MNKWRESPQFQSLLARLATLSAKYDAKPLNQQRYWLWGLLLVVCFIWYSLFASAVKEDKVRINSQLQQKQATIFEKQAEIATLSVALTERAQGEQDDAMQAIKKNTDAVKQRVAEQLEKQIDASEISQILQTVLDSYPGLDLIRMESQSRDEIVGEQSLTRHVVRVVIAGQYGDIQRYLAILNDGEQPLQFDAMVLAVDDYPRIKASLGFYSYEVNRAGKEN